MDEEKKVAKVDVSSTAIENVIDVAKSFVDRLILPSITELGLLARDQMSLWRFGNQVRILNKAKAICERNSISVKAIPPKILCPYLENASLEEDEELQEKWAVLLVNMADSEQNIQNHVFPYVLSQLSKNEFNLLESAVLEKAGRVAGLKFELSEFLRNRKKTENDLDLELSELKVDLEALSPSGQYRISPAAQDLRLKIHRAQAKRDSLAWNKEL